MKILLIIPSYNEEKNILDVYNEILNHNKKSEIKYDYLFINDCSKDESSRVFKENKIKNIELIHNLGIGGAVQTGYKYALENDYDVAIQFDGDNQHDINYIKNLIEPIKNNEVNMVIGSRFINNSSEFKSTRVRRLGIFSISLFIKLFTGKKIYDTTSGFRAVDKNLIKEFSLYYPTEYPEPISTISILKKGYKLKEVGVKMKERKNGESSIKAWKSVYYMINVILSIIITGIRRQQ